MPLSEFLPFVSVIIPTFQRELVLRNIISQVLSQDYPSFELIVIDQSLAHEPETELFLQEYSGQFANYHLQEPNVAAARNYGISCAKGEIILFLDDDVEINPNWILISYKEL